MINISRIKVLTNRVFSMEEVESILAEVRHEFGGVPLFWETLSGAPIVLGSYWNGFKRIISPMVLQRNTKLLIIYECVLADGCLRCKEAFRNVLEDFGIQRDTLEKLDGDIRGTNLDVETKDILIFAYYASNSSNRIDKQSLIEFKILVGKRKILETIACITICKSIIEMAHYLDMHAFEVRENDGNSSTGQLIH